MVDTLAVKVSREFVFRQHYMLPCVGTSGTTGINGITNGAFGKTLIGACVRGYPMVSLVGNI